MSKRKSFITFLSNGRNYKLFSRIQSTLSRVALIKQIAVGLIIGVLIAIFAPGAIPAVSILGDLFVKALKGIAPVLVFFLVMNAMAQRKENAEGSLKQSWLRQAALSRSFTT